MCELCYAVHGQLDFVSETSVSDKCPTLEKNFSWWLIFRKVPRVLATTVNQSNRYEYLLLLLLIIRFAIRPPTPWCV